MYLPFFLHGTPHTFFFTTMDSLPLSSTEVQALLPAAAEGEAISYRLVPDAAYRAVLAERTRLATECEHLQQIIQQQDQRYAETMKELIGSLHDRLQAVEVPIPKRMRLLPDETPKEAEMDVVEKWCFTNLRKPNWVLRNGTVFIQSGVITRIPKQVLLAAFQEAARTLPEETSYLLFSPSMTVAQLTRLLYTLLGRRCVAVSVLDGVHIYRIHPMEMVRTEFASYFLKDIHFRWT